jgi:hypothetical protein
MTASAWRYIALHVAGAAAFGFLLNRFALATSVEIALLWGIGLGAMAGMLAWQQTKR